MCLHSCQHQNLFWLLLVQRPIFLHFSNNFFENEILQKLSSPQFFWIVWSIGLVVTVQTAIQNFKHSKNEHLKHNWNPYFIPGILIDRLPNMTNLIQDNSRQYELFFIMNNHQITTYIRYKFVTMEVLNGLDWL